MSNVVNLNQFRKRKTREDKRRAGDENAAKHGVSKAEKTLAKARLEKENRDLDGHEKE
ncbi:DUF4169 family protein [Pacificoceanicola onchidii]|uniref:DUF4169 family protein n=1 Tax=Pacificoceanicola onchidii TaxID=2562685 RepID=UPI0010A32A71|nr:DUF4169 family protein [Pacificoceanicola onchidii]